MTRIASPIEIRAANGKWRWYSSVTEAAARTGASRKTMAARLSNGIDGYRYADDTPEMTTLETILTVVIGLTGYPAPAEMPQIETLSQQALDASMTYEMPTRSQRIGAAYREGTIYLPDDFDMTNLVHQSRLAHELAHHLQWLDGQTMHPDPCVSPIEAEAYSVQFDYLRHVGIDDPLDYLNADPWVVMRLTRCVR